jgi:hypothetical protein
MKRQQKISGQLHFEIAQDGRAGGGLPAQERQNIV